MGVLRLDSKQFWRYHARLAQAFKPAILRGVRMGAQRVVAMMIQRTRDAKPANPDGIGSGGAVNTGNFIRRWRKTDIAEGAIVGNDAGYSAIIEHGRRAGAKFPPKGPLIEWIKRKIVQPALRAAAAAKRAERAAAKAAKPTTGNPQRPKTGSERARDAADRRRQGPRKPAPLGPKQRKPGNADKMAARLYFPIARAIARRGLVGREILTATDIQPKIVAMVSEEVVRELDRVHKESG